MRCHNDAVIKTKGKFGRPLNQQIKHKPKAEVLLDLNDWVQSYGHLRGILAHLKVTP